MVWSKSHTNNLTKSCAHFLKFPFYVTFACCNLTPSINSGQRFFAKSGLALKVHFRFLLYLILRWHMRFVSHYAYLLFHLSFCHGLTKSPIVVTTLCQEVSHSILQGEIFRRKFETVIELANVYFQSRFNEAAIVNFWSNLDKTTSWFNFSLDIAFTHPDIRCLAFGLRWNLSN